MENKDIILSVKDLRVNFSTDHGYVQAVRGVSFDLYKGETLCIVGESGSGKSVTSKTIMGILAANGRIVNGSIMYEGEDLTKVSEDEFHRIRGHKIGMIFQDPLSSLNPIVRIGKQITEAMLLNGNHLKQMRDNIVANEFVAYKNAITEYNSELNKAKEAVKFLKAEKKKELERIKTIVKNETDGALYTLKLDHGLELVNIKHKYDALISDNQEDAEKVAKYKEEKEAIIKEANEKYAAKKAEIIATNKARAGENKELLAKTREEFNRKIAEAKVSKAANKPELAAKYKPLIAETKAKYLEKKKVANVQVKEAKAKFKQEYAEDLAKNREMRPQVTADAKAKYDSDLTALMNKYGPLFKEKKNDPNAVKQLQIEFNAKKKELKEARAKACFSVSDAAARQKYISKIKITKAEAKERALTIMREVGIPYPERRYRQYPFEFSGGMRQRIVIAIALTANPEILICDEPTTALDVTIQAQILELINRLKVERNMTVMFITHDLGVVANMADRVAVMYAGKIVEYGKEEEIFYDPKHPYTWALLSSIPDVDSKERLDAIPGTPPNLVYPPKGDAFALRSKYAMKIDFKKEPPLFKVTDTHYAATWLLDPRAPKVEMPAIVKTRIETSLAANKARLASKKAAEKGEAAPEAVEAPAEPAKAVKKPAAKKPAAKKAAEKPASEKKPAAKKATAKKGGK